MVLKEIFSIPYPIPMTDTHKGGPEVQSLPEQKNYQPETSAKIFEALRTGDAFLDFVRKNPRSKEMEISPALNEYLTAMMANDGKMDPLSQSRYQKMYAAEMG